MSIHEKAPWQGWSRWCAVELRFRAESLRLLLDDGQAFRWHFLDEGWWVGCWSHYLVALRLDSEGALEWSAPEKVEREMVGALHDYLAMGMEWERAVDSLPWRSDPHLRSCVEFAPGLRLLNQPFGETLLCFLCSATKQIPQIKVMTELMASSLGAAPQWEVPEACSGLSLQCHALPTWERLATASEEQLRACKLGFRAANVVGCAKQIAQTPGWLERVEQLPYAEAKLHLMSLPGVGEKIADCVLLYGGGKLEAFPVDTWIIKVMSRHYGLEGWKPESIAHFGRVHFGNHAGLAQQFLFNFERNTT